MKISLDLSGMVYWEFCRVYCLQLNKTVKELHMHPGFLPLPLHHSYLYHPTLYSDYTMTTSITPRYSPTTPWPPPSPHATPWPPPPPQTKQRRVERNENQIISNIQLSVPLHKYSHTGNDITLYATKSVLRTPMLLERGVDTICMHEGQAWKGANWQSTI